ncbi:MAG: TRAP transporter small permease [Syntrophales bacterium]|nr:TRAP transporter small permease [Syntrophales bacterium]
MFPKFMNGYKWLIDWIEKVEIFIASFLLGIMACIIMMEVVSRYFLNHPFPWVSELTTLLFLYLVFVGIPVMYKQKLLIILEFLFRRLPLRAQQYINLLWEVLIGVFIVFLIVSSYELQELQAHYLLPTLNISFRFFTIPILICGVSILLFNVYVVLTQVKKISGKEEEVLVEGKLEGKGGSES